MSGEMRELSLSELVEALPRPVGVTEPTHRAAKEYAVLVSRLEALRSANRKLAADWEKQVYRTQEAKDKCHRCPYCCRVNCRCGECE